MFNKTYSDQYPNRKLYYTYYDVLQSSMEFYNFLSNFSSSIYSMNISEDSDLGFKTIEGRYNFDQFMDIANSNKSINIDSVGIFFDDGQSMVYDVNRNELFCQSGNPNFDIDEYFNKKKGMTL